MNSSRFSPRIRQIAALAVLLLAGGALWRALSAQETREEKTLAEGLTLLSVQRPTNNGMLHFWIVRADKTAYQLSLEVADKTSILKKRSVRNLAKQSGALVAVNGGFFAYGGAAVGAVKVDGEWHRLPWKNRTALGWGENQAPRIAPLSGSLRVILAGETLVGGVLNGYTPDNSFAVLTARFGATYNLKADESALVFPENEPVNLVATGQFKIPSKGWVLVLRGALQTRLQNLNELPSASWGLATAPADWNSYPQILGAGPRLVKNGQIQTNEVEEEFRPDVTRRGPRTAVGWDKDGNWLLLVADWNALDPASSAGLTIPEEAALFREFGAVEAMNLDGGSSTQLVIDGELINTPSGSREVMVSNALILK